MFHLSPTYAKVAINPLTTDNDFWDCQFLAACYQLAQSVLKIGSVLTERVGQGEVGRCTTLANSAYTNTFVVGILQMLCKGILG